MNAPTPPSPALAGAPLFAEALARIVGSIIGYIFPRYHALGPIAIHVHNRISRGNLRIQRLMARLAAGTWSARKPRAKSPKSAAERPKTPYISRRFGWLGQKYDYFIRGYFGQLEHLLNTPDTIALLEAAPPEAIRSLGRTLRPLCHIFGVTPPKILQVEKPRRIRPPRPKQPRAERPPRPPTSYRMLRRALKAAMRPKGMAIWPDRIAARRKTD